MKRVIEGANCGQTTIFPELLNDYVDENNQVGVFDVFVDQLDLASLGLDRVRSAASGRPACHPSVLIKLYIYCYLNRIHSSRRLEREAQRNIDLMWLTGRFKPDFNPIANFRKDNGKSIRSVCRQFIVLYQQLDLFSDAVAAAFRRGIHIKRYGALQLVQALQILPDDPNPPLWKPDCVFTQPGPKADG